MRKIVVTVLELVMLVTIVGLCIYEFAPDRDGDKLISQLVGDAPIIYEYLHRPNESELPGTVLVLTQETDGDLAVTMLKATYSYSGKLRNYTVQEHWFFHFETAIMEDAVPGYDRSARYPIHDQNGLLIQVNLVHYQHVQKNAYLYLGYIENQDDLNGTEVLFCKDLTTGSFAVALAEDEKVEFASVKCLEAYNHT